jgi:hypothetical protein
MRATKCWIQCRNVHEFRPDDDSMWPKDKYIYIYIYIHIWKHESSGVLTNKPTSYENVTFTILYYTNRSKTEIISFQITYCICKASQQPTVTIVLSVILSFWYSRYNNSVTAIAPVKRHERLFSSLNPRRRFVFLKHLRHERERQRQRERWAGQQTADYQAQIDRDFEPQRINYT